MEKETCRDSRLIRFHSDVELPFEEKLNEIETQLTQEEEEMLREIIEAENQIEKKDFMDDLLSAVKKGAEDYVDAMTDTGDTFDNDKNSREVKQWDNKQIARKQKSSEQESTQPRTMAEANRNPFDNDSAQSTEGMNKEGIARFAMHKEAYEQRTKSITGLSTPPKDDSEGTKVKYKDDNAVNNESLSGLKGYRVGIVVPMDPIEDIQEKYKQRIQSKGEMDNKQRDAWIRSNNFNKYYEALTTEYGFENVTQAKKWVRKNHLTIHESPDGMILVPTDVHDRASHSGYCSQISKLLTGEISKDQFDRAVVQEKIAYVKHEAKQHSIRAVKGFGMAVVKDMMKFCIVTVSKETYNEFHQPSEEKFVQRMKRILNNCWQRFWAKFKNNLKKLFSGGMRSLLNEFLTMLNDYFLGVFKKIFKIVRQMWGSIKNAFKIICNKQYSWQERVFEAAKILSAGAVGVLGFSLNELLEQGLLAIGFPFASFVAECLSGLFAGILSAVVLMLFDNLKAAYKSNNAELQVLQQSSRLNSIYSTRIELDSLRADVEWLNNYQFFCMTLEQIILTREKILGNIRANSILQKELINIEIEEEKRKIKFSNLLNHIDHENF